MKTEIWHTKILSDAAKVVLGRKLIAPTSRNKIPK